ncbi:unnamed protein product [Heterobilharzia americana]|nr:unnamed protein product [Heterobilharzia americana]CAH8656446.1 unnamed protein product [Heterobilharzia americana]
MKVKVKANIQALDVKGYIHLRHYDRFQTYHQESSTTDLFRLEDPNKPHMAQTNSQTHFINWCHILVWLPGSLFQTNAASLPMAHQDRSWFSMPSLSYLSQ